MPVLVTGGTGFVGSHLIEALRAEGESVHALVRPGSDAGLIRRFGAVPVAGDLDVPESLVDVCRGCETVYHAAARVDIVGSDEDFHRTTVAGTQALVSAAAQAGIRRFVYVSSCGVYHPDIMRDAIIDERTPIRTPPHWFKYARAKLAAEEVVRNGLRPPIEWVIMRLGYLYGSRNRAMKQYLYRVLRSKRRMFIGRGDNSMALVHVSDAVAALVAAARVPQAAGKTLIAAGTEHVTQHDYFNALSDGFRLRRMRLHLPYRLAFLLSWIAEPFPFLTLGGVFRRAGVALTGLPQRIDCSYTRELLQWTPRIRFADGIREACDWFAREYGPLPVHKRSRALPVEERPVASR